MIYDQSNKSKLVLASWLQSVFSKIAFSDYESIERLQASITHLHNCPTPAYIETTVFKRSEIVNLWHRLIPICFLFLPAWLLNIIPLYKEELSFEQSAMAICMIAVSGICYLLTFFRDGFRYRIHLTQVRQNLLSVYQKQTVSIEQRHDKTTIPIPKGCIPMFLLNELVKKEAGWSSIFNASASDVMPFCKKLIGFDEKNFKKVMPQYRRRDDIILDSENARTTHIGYLDILIQHYHIIGETVLKQQATALQNFLNTTPLKATG